VKTLKALSALLSYPTPELIDALPEISAAIHRERVLPAGESRALDALIADLAGGDLYDMQERYVFLFDRTRSLSLHLFEHVHGESRARGQAMVDLLKLYEDGGFTPTSSELPDYLPLFLEYASMLPPAAAIELLGQPAHVLAALRLRLAKRSSPYEAVMSALVSLSKASLDAAALAALCEEPDPEPDDLTALDAAWEEEEVLFGPGAASDCGKDGLTARIRAAARPADGIVAQPARRPVVGAAPRAHQE
jgi:nitrate reductase delta subunit